MKKGNAPRSSQVSPEPTSLHQFNKIAAKDDPDAIFEILEIIGSGR
jgi:hypothetical protein